MPKITARILAFFFLNNQYTKNTTPRGKMLGKIPSNTL